MLIQRVAYQAIAVAALTFCGGFCSAQCSFVFDLPIPDNTSQSVEIDVSGLVNSDLAGSQGICGVNLEFRHDYLGDLSVELVSPSGQSIKLVGDITDQINPTNLTTWDVGFVPCGASAMPDPGFINVWNNAQDWEVFSTYTGTYFPFSGCFEDFNSGSANGTWQLIIGDAAPPATGVFVSVEIIFCDMTGLLCAICPANPGEFAETAVNVCEGQAIPPGSFDIDFPDGAPDPDTANLAYVVSNGTLPAIFTDDLYLFAWNAGSYSVCALSYLREDSAALFEIIDTMSLSEIHDEFGGGMTDYCAAISDQCLVVNVRPVPAPVDLDTSICSGAVYRVGDQTFSEAGEYEILLSTEAGCDSVVRLELEVVDLQARITQSDTLSCTQAEITLSASSSTVPGTAEYQWGSNAGGIVGPVDGEDIQITAPGIYSVTVTSRPSGCQSIASWDVVTDGSQPAIFIDDQVIDCNNPDVVLDPIVFPANVSYQWTGPAGFTSDLEAPIVTEAGVYWLVVTDPGGCSATQSVTVAVDTIIPEETSILVIKNCEIARTAFVARPPTATNFLWTGPNGFTSSSSLIDINDPGTYMLTATYANGCTDTTLMSASLDYTVPEVSIDATMDTIGCGESSLLTAQSTDAIETYNWTSSFLTANDTPSILVITPGVYYVEAEGANGCFGYDTVVVHPAAGLPEIITFTDTLSCRRDTGTIGVITTASVISYRWNGPAVIDTFTDFIRVAAPGLYRVEILELSGCVLFGSIEVGADFEKPRIAVTTDTLTCTNDTAALTVTGIDEIVDITWRKGGAVLGTDTFLLVDKPGTYQYTATGINGCKASRNVVLPFDTLGPTIYIQPTTFGCNDSVQLNVTPIDPVEQYSWVGPSNYTSSNQLPFIYEAGLYTLTATGANGCETIRSLQVKLQDEAPAMNITTELLDCLDSVAVFRATSQDTSASFEWLDLSEMLISDLDSVILDTPGEYTLVVTGANNCESRDTLQLAAPVTPAVYSDEDTINCRDEEVDLFAQSDSIMMTFTWFDSAGMLVETGPAFRASAPGVYTIIGVWTNGCASDTTVTVHIDTLRPTAVAMSDEIVRCDIREITISGSSSIGDSLSYTWSALSGTVLLGETRDSAFVQGPGEFVLNVTELINHCTDSDTLLVEEEPGTLSFMELSIIPECQGNLAGAIIFDSVHVADSPLRYSIGLNGSSLSPVFDSLVKGEYRVSVVDSFGCRLDSVVFVTETSSETSVSLGPDLEVLVGGMVTLKAKLDVDSTALSGIFWEPSLSCDSCLTNEVTPFETTDYTIYIRDPFGCLASDEVRVYVVERGQVYVPNVFTPNGDGTNDLITITAHPGVRLIKEFSIYDRWGDLMYRAADADPHTSDISWDGTFSGKSLNPAVYSYIMEIELITGRKEVLTGTITSLR